MARYKVLSNLEHDCAIYTAGDIVEIAEKAQADILCKGNVVEAVQEKERNYKELKCPEKTEIISKMTDIEALESLREETNQSIIGILDARIAELKAQRGADGK